MLWASFVMHANLGNFTRILRSCNSKCFIDLVWRELCTIRIVAAKTSVRLRDIFLVWSVCTMFPWFPWNWLIVIWSTHSESKQTVHFFLLWFFKILFKFLVRKCGFYFPQNFSFKKDIINKLNSSKITPLFMLSQIKWALQK